ncbi:MAG: ABC transporter permease, partial [Thermodesulfobacteriota bacterium]|nr:ABC transporter permease [Thermodesulfobacteriota bacterium]
ALRIFIYLGVGALLFHVHFNWARLPAALAVICLTIAAFSSLGIFSAGFIMLFKRGDPVNWGFNVISWLLGGVYYPVSILPLWLQKVASIIPMTHSLEALRLILLTDQGLSGLSDHLLVLGLWAVIGLPLSLLCFRAALNRARILGTLGHY